MPPGFAAEYQESTGVQAVIVFRAPLVDLFSQHILLAVFSPSSRRSFLDRLLQRIVLTRDVETVRQHVLTWVPILACPFPL